jgi:hypothetical protein
VYDQTVEQAIVAHIHTKMDSGAAGLRAEDRRRLQRESYAKLLGEEQVQAPIDASASASASSASAVGEDDDAPSNVAAVHRVELKRSVSGSFKGANRELALKASPKSASVAAEQSTIADLDDDVELVSTPEFRFEQASHANSFEQQQQDQPQSPQQQQQQQQQQGDVDMTAASEFAEDDVAAQAALLAQFEQERADALYAAKLAAGESPPTKRRRTE